MRPRDRSAGEQGSSAIEYSLLVAGIAAVLVMVVMAVGGQTLGLFGQTCDSMRAGSSGSLGATTC
ncbi:Flp family type IVb pilin [Nocardioides scoriae]|uniref:Flp family type IVb pilin n=1 Tax=Nocardioides scoriae TaxID=642780 RepID=UPI0012FC2EA8|nr:Flp family type IVb pilin [Nocardioides scoriae]